MYKPRCSSDIFNLWTLLLGPTAKCVQKCLTKMVSQPGHLRKYVLPPVCCVLGTWHFDRELRTNMVAVTLKVQQLRCDRLRGVQRPSNQSGSSTQARRRLTSRRFSADTSECGLLRFASSACCYCVESVKMLRTRVTQALRNNVSIRPVNLRKLCSEHNHYVS